MSISALLTAALLFPGVSIADLWVIELAGGFDYFLAEGEPLEPHDPQVPVRVVMTFDNESESAAGQQYVLDDLLHAEIESDLLAQQGADVRLVGQLDIRVLPDGTIDRSGFYAHLREDSSVPGPILIFSAGQVQYTHYGAPEEFSAFGVGASASPALEVLSEPTTSAGLVIGAATLLLLRWGLLRPAESDSTG